MTNIESARRYVSKIPGAISGSGGHSQTYWVTAACLHGFGLSPADTMDILGEYNKRCDPPWSQRELHHKVDSFDPTKCQKPAGWLLNSSTGDPEQDRRAALPQPSSGPRKIKYKLRSHNTLDMGTSRANESITLPQPIQNGMVRLLLAAFRQGEYVGIAPTEFNDEGREVPRREHDMVGFDREFWLKKLDDKIGLWHESRGLYMVINPINGEGRKDKDVTSFRHVLVESDTLPKVEQYRILKESGLPITAIVDSGGKSIHAWVRVDAKDIHDYREKQEHVYEWLSERGMPVDPANKNPARFTRGPNFIRRLGDGTSARQELLELNVGAESYAEWLAQLKAKELGDAITIDTLTDFDFTDDPNNLIGSRWLCRGGSCLWVGQSGVGKSSLTTQAAMTWALGKPFFGIRPVRPLKSLIVQAENDLGDLAEMVDGIREGCGGWEWDEIGTLSQNVMWHRDTVHTGKEFCQVLLSLIQKHTPDLVWLDPMLSFIGGDISKQEVCSQFLRNWLGPIAASTGVCFMLVHHTGKPPKDKNTTKDWNTNDFAYMGMGSSELVNWARAVNIITEVTDGLFRFMMAKRGKRAKATSPDGIHTTHVYLKHAERGIYWEQVSESDVQREALAKSAIEHNEQQAQKETIYDYLRERFDWDLLKSRMHTSGMNKTELRTAIADILADRKNFGRDSTPPPFARVRFISTPLENHDVDPSDYGVIWSEMARVYYLEEQGEPLPEKWNNQLLTRPEFHPAAVIDEWPESGIDTKSICQAYIDHIGDTTCISVSMRMVYERFPIVKFMEENGMLELAPSPDNQRKKFYRPTTTTTHH